MIRPGRIKCVKCAGPSSSWCSNSLDNHRAVVWLQCSGAGLGLRGSLSLDPILRVGAASEMERGLLTHWLSFSPFLLLGA